MAAKRKPGAKTKAKAKTKVKAKAKTNKKTKAKAGARAGKTARAPRKPTPAVRKRALAILDGLKREHPDAHCELDFTNALELLIATILAAQCTDARVNIVTKSLFKKYRTAQDYLDAKDETLMEEIHSTGFFRNKTKSIKRACASIVENFGGEIPGNIDDLLKLAGVGRKTANVILANVFNVPGVVVDTHMLRLSRRMGFTDGDDATRVEFEMMEIFPESGWIDLSHLIPWHGRRVCTARKPACDSCAVANVCPQLL